MGDFQYRLVLVQCFHAGLVFSDDLANDKALAAEAARMANISRTAQLSIAQIMAGLEENPAPSAGPAPAPEATPAEPDWNAVATPADEPGDNPAAENNQTE